MSQSVGVITVAHWRLQSFPALMDRRQIHGTELIHVDEKLWLNSPCIGKQIGEKLVFGAAIDEGVEGA